MEHHGWRLGIHHHRDGTVTVLLMQVGARHLTIIRDCFLGRNLVLVIFSILIHLLYHTTNIKRHEMQYLPEIRNDTWWCHN